MPEPSPAENRRDSLRTKIIGLGERSLRKSHYSELQDKLKSLELMKEAAETATQRLEAALASISEGFVTIDRQWRTMYANAQAATLTGRAAAELIGNSFWDAFPAAIGRDFRPQLEHALAEGISASFGGFDAAEDRWYETHVYPSAEGLTLVIADITERKRGQDALQTAKVAAERANLAKSRFLANVSHEIRTPMNAILGFTDLLLAPDLSAAEREEFAGIIRENGQVLLQLINDILDLSMIEAEKMTVEMTVCSPSRIIDEVLALMRLRAAEKGLTLRAECEASVPSAILTDPIRLRQILVNLVGNAIKFTSAGSVRVRVWTGRTPSGASTVRFSVIDTGIGIPPEFQTQIFQPFTQADTSFSRRFGGSGLGLAICSRVAASLNATLEMTSETGKGSTFTLVLAPEAGCALSHSETPTPAAAPPAQPPRLGGRVLLAEDVDASRDLFSRILRKAGLQVDEAINGQQVLQVATAASSQGQAYDLILMDIQMPEMDGLEATRQLRAMGWTRPIIALTAHAMAGDRQRCLDAGCDDYLCKPVQEQQLQRALARYLAHPVGESTPL